MYEELNLRDEQLVPTSHPKIRSYVGNHNMTAGQIKAFLHSLQEIVDRRDVASLVLLLKAKIPDYNPSFQLLKTTLSGKPNQTDLDKFVVSSAKTQVHIAVNTTPTTLLN
jgi:hypothetical protein